MERTDSQTELQSLGQGFQAAGDAEFEYEYDKSETETFYVNVDLTSLNGLIPQRRRSATSVTVASPDGFGALNDRSGEVGESDGDGDAVTKAQDRIQIMDLHTSNPIISYQNQVFSCSWINLIGTELTFASPKSEISDLGQVLRKEDDFELISASQAKIVGQKVNLIPVSGRKIYSKLPHNDTAISSFDKSEDASGPSSAMSSILEPTLGPASNQGLFLERLMSLKRHKGESDTVRTVFPQKRAQNLEAVLRGWARTEQQREEVEQLNRKALDGDVDALAMLEEICAQTEQ